MRLRQPEHNREGQYQKQRSREVGEELSEVHRAVLVPDVLPDNVFRFWSSLDCQTEFRVPSLEAEAFEVVVEETLESPCQSGLMEVDHDRFGVVAFEGHEYSGQFMSFLQFEHGLDLQTEFQYLFDSPGGQLGVSIVGSLPLGLGGREPACSLPLFDPASKSLLDLCHFLVDLIQFLILQSTLAHIEGFPNVDLGNGERLFPDIWNAMVALDGGLVILIELSLQFLL